MRVYTAPNLSPDKYHPYSVFLAGSIEMGKAEPWQAKAIEQIKLALHDCKHDHYIEKLNRFTIFNPRRADWDVTWKQGINEPQFCTQVSWELQHIEAASHVFFYFDPNTQSPITLMELGLIAGQGKGAMYRGKKVYVVCPNGYFRQGNVQILCKRFDLEYFEDFDRGIEALIDNMRFYG